MYPLVETIRIVNGMPKNLKWHQLRYENSVRIYFRENPNLILEDTISIPVEYRNDTVKCRFLYNKDAFKTEFFKYTPSKIKTLKLIENNEIEYSLKFTNRSSIERLLQRKGDCDDILIIKNGWITDTSIANIVFFDGSKWITPAEPLLKGTTRERLLSEGKITATDMRTKDLKNFLSFRLINAMLEFEKQEIINSAYII